MLLVKSSKVNYHKIHTNWENVHEIGLPIKE